ncbi:MAG TPA: cyclic nucleotide-binding domain-containing protein [Rhizomicrobium sp.]|nr:cyclic nucleotide-binding domain-containing protein [Rhizomicrobium sp.]
MSMTLSAARKENFGEVFPPALVPITLNDHLRALQPYSARQRFNRGETIFSEGDPANHVYKVLSGTVRICRHAADGRRYIFDFMMPGDLIGFLECPDQPITAEAVTEVTLISYPKSSFDRLAASSAEVRTRLLCHLSASLRTVQQHLFVLGCQNAKERVASFLLRLADRNDVGAGQRLDLTMGRQDIADHLGLTIETVCRAIAVLRNDRLVTIPNTHQIILNDIRALRALAIEA